MWIAAKLRVILDSSIMASRAGPIIAVIQPQFFQFSALSVVVGTVMAFASYGLFDVVTFILALISIACIHAGVNSGNEYFDFRSGADLAVTEDSRFGGGTKVLPRGMLQPRTVLLISLVSFSLGALIGLVVVLRTGPWVGLLGFTAALLGFFYTAPPVKLAYRALGELFVGLAFGPIMVLGAMYAQAMRVNAGAILVSLVIGLLNAAAIVCHRYPDCESDAATGKVTLVVRYGKRRSRWIVAGLLALAPLPLVLAYTLSLVPRALAVVATVTLPICIWLGFRFIRGFSDKQDVEAVGLGIMRLMFFVPLAITLGYLATAFFGDLSAG